MKAVRAPLKGFNKVKSTEFRVRVSLFPSFFRTRLSTIMQQLFFFFFHQRWRMFVDGFVWKVDYNARTRLKTLLTYSAWIRELFYDLIQSHTIKNLFEFSMHILILFSLYSFIHIYRKLLIKIMTFYIYIYNRCHYFNYLFFW